MTSSRTTTKCGVGVAILGAGRSRRMGQAKLLLPWRATTVVGHIIGQWRELGVLQITVVHAQGAQEIERELIRMGLGAANQILNPVPERGMFSSIQCAATWEGWNRDLTHFVLALGDQPHLRVETLRALLQFGSSHPNHICQPMRNGHRKHPVWLPREVFFALKESSAPDLKHFLRRDRAILTGFESDDAGLDLDLDTPQDYDRAKGLEEQMS